MTELVACYRYNGRRGLGALLLALGRGLEATITN
jgi:hypothetical protein